MSKDESSNQVANNRSGFPRRVLPRILFTIFTIYISFSFIQRIGFVFSRIDIGYGSLPDEISLLIALLPVAVFGWYVFDGIPSIAAYLGFRTKNEREFYISGVGNVVHVSQDVKKNASADIEVTRIGLQHYENGVPLKALEQARGRLDSHILRLQNSSIVNLFIGIAIAFVGIAVIGSTFLEIEKYVDKQNGFNTNGFIVFVLLPRLSISIFVQIFSLFFLLMYRSNINDVKYFQNEITNIDFAAAAVSFIKIDGDRSKKSVIEKFIKVERNRTAKKNERIISSPEDSDLFAKIACIDGKLNGALGKINNTSEKVK